MRKQKIFVLALMSMQSMSMQSENLLIYNYFLSINKKKLKRDIQKLLASLASKKFKVNL